MAPERYDNIAAVVELTEGVWKDIYTADDWVDIVIWHTADEAGDCLISFQQGQKAANVPRGMAIPFRMPPNSKLRAFSLSGSRQLNFIVSPIPRRA